MSDVDVEFRTSSYSNGGACVEFGVASTGVVYVRDSKDPGNGTCLRFDGDSWAGFVSAVELGT